MHDDSALRAELEDLEPEGENAKARRLWYKPLLWLGVLQLITQREDWPLPLWQTFFTSTIGFPLPLLRDNPGQSKVCGCRKLTSLSIMLVCALLTQLRRLLMTGQ